MSPSDNRICHLFDIKYPIIQAGMVWCSGWELASAVSNAGGLGIIGSGSMYPDILDHHIAKCKEQTDKPFAVNVPLLYPEIERQMEVILDHDVKIVFTSAGNPATWTLRLKDKGVKVVHVVSSAKFARKSEAAGVDAVVAEGFEAGGHNGREETTTMVLVPLVCRAVSIPVIAAGGIGSGKAVLAAMALGAEAVQIGSLFASSMESSAHQAFKNQIVRAGEGDTMLTMKKLTPVRLIRNSFYEAIEKAENEGADKQVLAQILGRGRAKLGMFEGNVQQGELEIGQISAAIDQIRPAAEIFKDVWKEFETEKHRICSI